MSLDPHVTPVIALLEARPYLGAGANSAPVFLEKVPDGTEPPYVKVYVHIRYQGGEDLPNTSKRAVCRFITHSVGSTVESSLIVAGNVREAWMDVKPLVLGRICWPIRDEQSIPPDSDESTGVLVMDTINVWRLESVPAP